MRAVKVRTPTAEGDTTTVISDKGRGGGTSREDRKGSVSGRVEDGGAEVYRPSFASRNRAIATASDDIARESWAMRHGAAFMAPGYVLLTELSSQGGSTAEDYIEEGRRGS